MERKIRIDRLKHLRDIIQEGRWPSDFVGLYMNRDRLVLNSGELAGNIGGLAVAVYDHRIWLSWDYIEERAQDLLGLDVNQGDDLFGEEVEDSCFGDGKVWLMNKDQILKGLDRFIEKHSNV